MACGANRRVRWQEPLRLRDDGKDQAKNNSSLVKDSAVKDSVKDITVDNCPL